jgi:hypothetical protein
MAGRQCVEVGLVQGKHLSVDGSFVEANAAKESRIPREQLREAAQVHHTVRQYLRELEQQNPVEEPVHEQDQVSTTDPDSTYATRGGMPARLGYYDNYLVDNQSCVIVGVQATAARMSQEAVAAQDMLTRFAQWQDENSRRWPPTRRTEMGSSCNSPQPYFSTGTRWGCQYLPPPYVTGITYRSVPLRCHWTRAPF